jgi:hypothetical protein
MHPPAFYPIHRNNFFPPPKQPQVPQFQLPSPPQNIITSQCKSIQFTKSSHYGWYGNIAIKSPSDSKAANIDVEFDEPIIVLVVTI